MAGINISIDEQSLQNLFSKLNELSRFSQEPRIALAQIGESLQRSTRERFTTQTAPDGTPWEPLSQNTKKHRNQNKILTLRGHLQSKLRWQADNTKVELGTNSVYAAVHQFGMKKGYAGTGQFKTKKGSFQIPWGNIPARPFLGISSSDQNLILKILETHIAKALNNNA